MLDAPTFSINRPTLQPFVASLGRFDAPTFCFPVQKKVGASTTCAATLQPFARAAPALPPFLRFTPNTYDAPTFFYPEKVGASLSAYMNWRDGPTFFVSADDAPTFSAVR